ncbi:hypothetical protein VC83_03084 [Pseudogymnoascus destructans]|uniref:Uncharacterized protein n=1 Tax=Pseudogymnoascus destructans TaxID=655981 RepID=A0A177ADV4_9PEZI|nr:uncharacterized protein VC83_03084 [Pseudogymnoascus destructans]OAF59980.1 hypothetical protein VC83_03084 [Pseudogymnoascus destructans]
MAPPSKFPAVMAQPRILEGPPDISLADFQQFKGSRKSQALAEMAHSRAVVALAACSRCMKGTVKHEFACCTINTTAHPDGRCTNCAHFTGTGSCSFLGAAGSGVAAGRPPPAAPRLVISAPRPVGAAAPRLVVSAPRLIVSAPRLVVVILTFVALIVSASRPVGAASPAWGPASLEAKDGGNEGDEGDEGDWGEKEVEMVGASGERQAVLGLTYREAEDEWLQAGCRRLFAREIALILRIRRDILGTDAGSLDALAEALQSYERESHVGDPDLLKPILPNGDDDLFIIPQRSAPRACQSVEEVEEDQRLLRRRSL